MQRSSELLRVGILVPAIWVVGTFVVIRTDAVRERVVMQLQKCRIPELSQVDF